MNEPLRRHPLVWIAPGVSAVALAGCVFLDWSVPSSGHDGGVGGSACGSLSACDDQNDCTDDACDPTTMACSHTPLPSGTSCATAGGYVCDGNGVCVGGPIIWARTFKGATASSALGHLAVDANGDVSFAGTLGGAVDLGGGSMTTADGGPPGLGVASYGYDGTYRWSTLRGADGATLVAEGSTADPQGHVLAAAYMSGSSVDFGLGKITAPAGSTVMVLAEYGADGGAGAVYAHDHAATPSDGGVVVPTSLTGDPAGNAYVLGAFTGSLTLGATKLTSGNHFVGALGDGGSFNWAVSFQETTGPQPVLAVDPARGVLVTGAFVGLLDLGSTTFDQSSTTVAVFLARFQLDGGTVDLAKSFAVPSAMAMGAGVPTSIAVDADGNILLAGVLTAPIDFGGGPLAAPSNFVVKLDPSGKHLWSHAIGSDTTSAPIYVAASGTDTLIAGAFQNPADFGDGNPVTSLGKHDAYLARYDASGTLLYVDLFADPSDQTISGLAIGPDGSIFVSGNDQGTVMFDGSILDGGTPGGLFLVKLGP